MKQLILLLTIITFLSGCSSSTADNITANANTTLAIEGMTCETGCAKRIEQKIAKMEGVKSCEVDFENKKATVIYDDKKVNEENFVSMVEGLNDSQYKVSEIETEKLSNANTNTSSSEEDETGNILSGSSFELPNIMEYFKNII